MSKTSGEGRPAAGRPDVSVIVPTHNRASVVARAIRSALRQEFDGSLEVVVVDDCSTDDTEGVVGALGNARVRYVRTERNVGGSGARNVGIAQARGAVLAFLDDDDEWYASKLARQVPLLDRFDAALCGFDLKDSRRTNVLATEVISLVHLRKRSPAPTSALVARADVMRALRFDERLPNGQEWDLYMRLLQRGAIGYVSAPLLCLDANRDDSITAGAKQVRLRDIGERMMAVEKHKERLGPYWYRYRRASHILMYFRQRDDRRQRLIEALRTCGVVTTAHLMFDRAAQRIGAIVTERTASGR